MSRRSLKPGRRRCCDFLRYAATDWKVAYRQLKKPKQIEIIRNQTGDDADSCKGIFFVQDKTKDSIMDRNRWFQEGLHSKTWHSSKHSQLSCLLSASLLVEYRIVKITSCLTRLRSQHSGLKSRVYSSGRHPSLTNRPCWQWFFHQVRNHRAATYTNSREFFAKTLRLAICYLQFANSCSFHMQGSGHLPLQDKVHLWSLKQMVEFACALGLLCASLLHILCEWPEWKLGSSYCTLVNHVSWEPSRMIWILSWEFAQVLYVSLCIVMSF